MKIIHIAILIVAIGTLVVYAYLGTEIARRNQQDRAISPEIKNTIIASLAAMHRDPLTWTSSDWNLLRLMATAENDEYSVSVRTMAIYLVGDASAHYPECKARAVEDGWCEIARYWSQDDDQYLAAAGNYTLARLPSP